MASWIKAEKKRSVEESRDSISWDQVPNQNQCLWFVISPSRTVQIFILSVAFSQLPRQTPCLLFDYENIFYYIGEVRLSIRGKRSCRSAFEHSDRQLRPKTRFSNSIQLTANRFNIFSESKIRETVNLSRKTVFRLKMLRISKKVTQFNKENRSLQ